MTDDKTPWWENFTHVDETLSSKEDVEHLIDAWGFLPFFRSAIPGFSLEEHIASRFWFGAEPGAWEWKGAIIRDGYVYGKIFEKKCGFATVEWYKHLANWRRDGYDFDARWDDGLASRREKTIMDLLTDRDEDGDVIWTEKQILTTDLKKIAGFGKSRSMARAGGAHASVAGKNARELRENEGAGAPFKNFQGVVTGLMMQTYLVTVDFHRRENKRGEEYGMPVSVMLPPEAVWGYEQVTSAYSEAPEVSKQRLYDRVRELYPQADDAAVAKLIGK